MCIIPVISLKWNILNPKGVILFIQMFHPYAGSILAVTVSDPYAPGKENRFVGICVERKNFGLGASFKLRNCIDEQGAATIL